MKKLGGGGDDVSDEIVNEVWSKIDTNKDGSVCPLDLLR